MKKFLGIAIIVALLSFGCSAYGAVAISDEYADQERYVGEATNIKIEGQDCSSDGSQVTILANGHKDGVTSPTTAKVTNITGTPFLAYGVISFDDLGNMGGAVGDVGAGVARYIALANGTPGQMITIIIESDSGGTLYITDDQISSDVFTMTNTGWDDIAFDSALDSVTLLYVDDSVGWILIGENSVTVT